MRRILRAFLSPSAAIRRVVLPVMFHLRRSHRGRAGRAVVCRRLRHKRVGAVSPALVFRPVHIDTTGKYILLCVHVYVLGPPIGNPVLGFVRCNYGP